MTYVAPSIETIEKHNLFPFIRRALGLIHSVAELDHSVWEVNGHVVRWDGAGFVCDCMNFEMYSSKQGGHCKHTLAVCLRARSYRDRIIAAMEEKEVQHELV